MAIVAHSKNLLLSALSREDYALLRPHLAEVRLKQKTVLQQPNEPISHVYFPLSGMISMLAILTTGEAIEIAAIGREGGQRLEIAFAQAIVQLPGTALKITIEKFHETASKSPAIVDLAACASEIMAVNLQQSAACNALHPLEARLARWLLHSRDRYDADELPLSHSFLSEMLGVRRTTVSLAAQTLQNAGVIHYSRGRISIADRKGLLTVSCDCYRTVKQNIAAIVVPEKSAAAF
jgi:CRP-like cAMP-binding protein